MGGWLLGEYRLHALSAATVLARAAQEDDTASLFRDVALGEEER